MTSFRVVPKGKEGQRYSIRVRAVSTLGGRRKYWIAEIVHHRLHHRLPLDAESVMVARIVVTSPAKLIRQVRDVLRKSTSERVVL